MSTKNITPENLANFYGSQQMFKNFLFRGIVYTEGVQFLAANGAGWLVDAILSHAVFNPKVKREDFIVAKLTITERTAILTFDDGNGRIVAKQNFEFVDFPLPEISFYVENHTLMLPSER